jgi:hypothetical protein
MIPPAWTEIAVRVGVSAPAADNDFQYRVYGSQQDNSSVGIRTRSDRGYIDRGDWDAVGGGESGYIVADPRDSNIVYADDEGPSRCGCRGKH